MNHQNFISVIYFSCIDESNIVIYYNLKKPQGYSTPFDIKT